MGRYVGRPPPSPYSPYYGHYGRGGGEEGEEGSSGSHTPTPNSNPALSGGGYERRSNTIPPVEFRGRHGFLTSPRQPLTPHYVNTHSDLDPQAYYDPDPEHDPAEDEFLLPPYPEVREEWGPGEGVQEEEEEEREGEVTERSALNFVSGASDPQGSAVDQTFIDRRSSQV